LHCIISSSPICKGKFAPIGHIRQNGPAFGKRTRRLASADRTARRQFQFQYLCISCVHLFYDMQWKRIRGIPFILKSHNSTQQSKMHILNQVQVNLIYNTRRNLFLWIEIFIYTTNLYNATADAWSCHLPTNVHPMGVSPFAFRYQGNGAIPLSILIPLERQLIALQLCR